MKINPPSYSLKGIIVLKENINFHNAIITAKPLKFNFISSLNFEFTLSDQFDYKVDFINNLILEKNKMANTDWNETINSGTKSNILYCDNEIFTISGNFLLPNNINDYQYYTIFYEKINSKVKEMIDRIKFPDDFIKIIKY